ncbi:MAG: hypothetical protein COB93_08265 [Sneathiella sp.]|nr:MAG: hypothetical protein COB93_08265 [Sneathiella sp.]
MFVLSFLAVLGVIGAAAWLFLNTLRDIPEGTTTASAEIATPAIAENPEVTTKPPANAAEQISSALSVASVAPSPQTTETQETQLEGKPVVDAIDLGKKEAEEKADSIAETPATPAAASLAREPIAEIAEIAPETATPLARETIAEVVETAPETVTPLPSDDDAPADITVTQADSTTDTRPAADTLEAIVDVAPTADIPTPPEKPETSDVVSVDTAASVSPPPTVDESIAPEIAPKSGEIVPKIVAEETESPAEVTQPAPADLEKEVVATVSDTPAETPEIVAKMPEAAAKTIVEPLPDSAKVDIEGVKTAAMATLIEENKVPPVATDKLVIDQKLPVIMETAAEVPVETAVVPTPPAIAETEVASPELPLWKKNARPFDGAADQPRIAFIISDLGMSKTRTAAVIDGLPAAITLAFNPYSRTLGDWMAKARKAGHEVLLQLPMEPVGYPKINPGPRALLTSLTTFENLDRLNWILGRAEGYVGITNQMGSKFTASRDHIQPVLEIIKERGLLFLDSRTASNSVGARVASELGLPVALNNRFLDDRVGDDSFNLRLAELERIAHQNGVAVGVGYPYPATIERLTKWAESLAAKGITLAPISAVVDRQEIK